jgi:hypothetical protein
METFSLYWTDISGEQHTEFKFRPMREVRSAIERLTQGPGRLVVSEIKVVDVLDCLCWHFKDGQVVTE